MFQIPLSNSDLLVEVSGEDYLTLLLLGPWCLNGSGYPQTTSKPKRFLHHVVAARMDLVVKETIDHKDRNKLNSKRDNLRPATYSEQLLNRDIQSNNTSGYPGISWNKKDRKWHVRFKGKHLGSFENLEDAKEVRSHYT